MIAHLGQPFNALLLAQQPNGERKRVLSEHEIAVLGTRDQHHPQEHLDKSPGNLVMRGCGLGSAVGFKNLLCAFDVPVIRFAWGGDSESDTDSDSDADRDTGLDSVVPSSSLHVVLVPQFDDYTRILQMLTAEWSTKGSPQTTRLSFRDRDPTSPQKIFRRRSWNSGDVWVWFGSTTASTTLPLSRQRLPLARVANTSKLVSIFLYRALPFESNRDTLCSASEDLVITDILGTEKGIEALIEFLKDTDAFKKLKRTDPSQIVLQPLSASE
ncbi:hypothetical protein EDC04DRAFT_2888916 [Pisolithus marmoratus]|nr:hypothetical protein EDC04DRAFT_2888916 [Pisolithus marmoratus]